MKCTQRRWAQLVLAVAGLCLTGLTHSREAAPLAQDPAVEARMVAPLAPEERAQLAAWLAACAAALEEDAP